MVLSILLVTKKVELLNRYILSYLEWVDTSNTLKTEEKFFLMIKDGDVLDKHNEIWGLIQEKLNNKFHSILAYDETLIKDKVREFDSKTKTNILGGKVPEENMHLICIVSITLDSVMRIEKKNYPHVSLEECKYRIKKIQMSWFINTKLKYESEPQSESESDTELMAKLESVSDSEEDTLLSLVFQQYIFADFEQVKKINSHFNTFIKSKKLIVIFWLWTIQKLNWQQNSLGINWMATTSYHWHSTLVSQTHEGVHQLWALPIREASFLNLNAEASSFYSPLTQSVRLPMVTYPSLCSTCVT